MVRVIKSLLSTFRALLKKLRRTPRTHLSTFMDSKSGLVSDGDEPYQEKLVQANPIVFLRCCGSHGSAG